MPEPRDSRRRAVDLTALATGAAFIALAAWLITGGTTPERPAFMADVATESAVPAMAVTASAPPQLVAAASAADAAPSTTTMTGNTTMVAADPGWTATVSARTGIPARALQGYAGAELKMSAEAPGCGIRWTTLAAIGSIESGHGTHGGAVLSAEGVAVPGIFGAELDGGDTERITDTDSGALDGLTRIDRAVGPMQFIPATWAQWGADGNGDGGADPQQIDDAALAAARYLCASGNLDDAASWRRAIFSYNHLESYVDGVAVLAIDYASQAGG